MMNGSGAGSSHRLTQTTTHISGLARHTLRADHPDLNHDREAVL